MTMDEWAITPEDRASEAMTRCVSEGKGENVAFYLAEAIRQDRQEVLPYKSWAIAMCSLLDQIEIVADDEDSVRELLKGRFALAKQYGLTVERSHETSGSLQ